MSSRSWGSSHDYWQINNWCTPGSSKYFRNKIQLLTDHVYKQKNFLLIRFPNIFIATVSLIMNSTQFYWGSVDVSCVVVARMLLRGRYSQSPADLWFRIDFPNVGRMLLQCAWTNCSCIRPGFLRPIRGSSHGRGGIRGQDRVCSVEGASCSCSRLQSRHIPSQLNIR